MIGLISVPVGSIRGAVSCTGFRDDGALSSHLIFGDSICSVSVVESAAPTIDRPLGLGRKIGTNADFTTSIVSSSSD